MLALLNLPAAERDCHADAVGCTGQCGTAPGHPRVAAIIVRKAPYRFAINQTPAAPDKTTPEMPAP